MRGTRATTRRVTPRLLGTWLDPTARVLQTVSHSGMHTTQKLTSPSGLICYNKRALSGSTTRTREKLYLAPGSTMLTQVDQQQQRHACAHDVTLGLAQLSSNHHCWSQADWLNGHSTVPTSISGCCSDAPRATPQLGFHSLLTHTHCIRAPSVHSIGATDSERSPEQGWRHSRWVRACSRSSTRRNPSACRHPSPYSSLSRGSPMS